MRHLSAAVVSVVLFAASLAAHSNLATVTGLAIDDTGAIIPGAAGAKGGQYALKYRF